MNYTDTKIRRDIERAQQRTAMADLHKLEPREAARRLDRYCPHCKALQVPRVKHYVLPWLGEERPTFVWPDRCGCPEETEAATDAGKARTRQAKIQEQANWDSVLDEAGLGLDVVGWLRAAHFDNFSHRPEWPAAKEKKEYVYQYAEQMVNGGLGDKSFLLLFGDYGTGKSHLAASVVRYALDAGWRECHYCEWTRWTERVKESWNDHVDTTGLHAKLREGKLVVLDDLDKKAPTGWTREVLYPILNHRYNIAAFTVLTFNVGPGDADEDAPGRLAIEQYLGRAILDRVMERAFLAVEFSGPSYRSGAQVPAQEAMPWNWNLYNGQDEDEG